MYDQIHTEALAAFDRIIGLDLTEVSIDGSLHKAPYGGQGTGRNPTDRAKLGWKWSVGVDLHGVPIGWAIDGVNRSDVKLLESTLDALAAISGATGGAGVLRRVSVVARDSGRQLSSDLDGPTEQWGTSRAPVLLDSDPSWARRHQSPSGDGPRLSPR